MDAKRNIEKVSGILKKYRYACIVVLVGILLMVLPVGTSQRSREVIESIEVQEPSMEMRLTNILSQIRGAGKVSVMLTVAAGEETVFQSDYGSNGQKDTVTITDKDRNQSGMIVQVLPPRYLGAVIVCQGADDPQVRLAVTAAVSGLTGLGADKISVIRMK